MAQAVAQTAVPSSADPQLQWKAPSDAPNVVLVSGVITGSRPGYSGFHSKDTASVAEVLRENGFNCATFGKWRQTASWQSAHSGQKKHKEQQQ